MISIIILSLIFTLIDQVSKVLVIEKVSKEIVLIKEFLSFTYAKNKGAAFSILPGQRVFLIMITIVIVGLLIYYIKKNKVNKKLQKISFALLIGGSLGNLIDRVVRGYVVDFISVKIFKYNFPVFNIADSFICIGIVLLLLTSLGKERNHDN